MTEAKTPTGRLKEERRPRSLGHVLDRLARKPRRLVIGLMSGTSVDAVTAAAVEIAGRYSLERGRPRLSLLGLAHRPYPPELRRSVFEAFDPGRAGADRLSLLNVAIGEAFAQAAQAAAAEAGLPLDRFDFIGSHGQTIWHQPDPIMVELPGGPRPLTSTLQLGEPAVIAERTGLTVVSGFRGRDMALGGQGAPLVPLFDLLVYGERRRSLALQNLGGIANVTVLPAGRRLADVFAFDSGPGNMLIDALVESASGGAEGFDRDGARAARGRVSPELLTELMAHPYLSRTPPKSTGREEFGRPFAVRVRARGPALGLSDDDLIATATEFTAASIADAYDRFIRPRGRLARAVLAGGGAHNPVLVAAIRRRLAAVPGLGLKASQVVLQDDVGLPAEAKEAVAFALLADVTLRGLPGNVPGATGASGPAVLGVIAPPPMSRLRD